MISFHDFTLSDEGPIYRQILDHIKKGIVLGTVCDGDELPSRRMLSTILGVNPNTVQKAYVMLEEQGLVASRMGAKSTIVLDDDTRQKVKTELTQECTRKAVQAFRELGIDRTQALELLGQQWDKEETV